MSLIFNIYGLLVVLILAIFSAIFLWWFPNEIVVLLVLLLLDLILFGSWVVIFKNSDFYFQQILKITEVSRNKEIDDLKASLEHLKSSQGLGQLDLIQSKYEDLVQVLNHRFSANELTLQRYLSSATDLYNGVLRNLREAVLSLQSIQSSDIDFLRDEVVRLDGDKTNEKEIAAKVERIRIYEQQSARSSELLLLNEEALTLMAKMSSEWANTVIGQDADLESSDKMFQQAQSLIQKIKSYDAKDS